VTSTPALAAGAVVVIAAALIASATKILSLRVIPCIAGQVSTHRHRGWWVGRTVCDGGAG
jgi:hypothetical protein